MKEIVPSIYILVASLYFLIKMFDNFREGVRRSIKVGRERVAASEKLRKTAVKSCGNYVHRQRSQAIIFHFVFMGYV
jgi:hypothetical protein